MCRKRILPAAAIVLVSLAAAAWAQEDETGLLPPRSADRSRRLADIRRAVAAADFGVAQTKIDQLIEHEPDNYEGPLWRGFLEIQRKESYNAVRWLRRAELLNPNAHVLKMLAIAYYSARQYKLFLLKMGEAAERAPDDFAPYYFLGRYYDSDLTDFAMAGKYFRQALDHNPNHARSHYHLGYCYEVEQKLESAEKEYKRAIELAEEQGARHEAPYRGLARLQMAAHEPAKALPYARQAVELAPRQAAPHKLLARIYSELGREAEAAPEWERACALEPAEASTLYRLYRTYAALEQTEKAKAALARYKKTAARYGTN
jgi:Tfp pilus assembly protein PilF